MIANSFSTDRRWWWNGEAWMPARSPDGSYAKWDGKTWVVSSRSSSRYLAVGLTAAGLWVLQLVWAFVAVILLIFQANDEYHARGSVGTEDISSTAISVPIFVSLLILPLLMTALSSALIPHRWLLAPVIGGWPLVFLVLIDALTRGPG